MTAAAATWDERRAQLSRTAKFKLILMCRSGVRRPDGGLSYIEGAHPLQDWSKDDIIASILAAEYPEDETGLGASEASAPHSTGGE
jgi:hypothetical protein